MIWSPCLDSLRETTLVRLRACVPRAGPALDASSADLVNMVLSVSAPVTLWRFACVATCQPSLWHIALG